MVTTKPTILMIGNFLSASGFNRAVCEDLRDQLQRRGWPVIATSTRVNRPARLTDMLWTIWRRRRDYQVTQLDVFSGPAFIWAELATMLLRRLKKPYILTLHGGNLSKFAKRNPRRVRRVLSHAVAVTTPSRFLQESMQPYYADLQLLPNPLDFSNYRYRERTVPQPRLIWLRAFHAIYNPTLAVRVAVKLRSEFPKLQLTMIGPDKGNGSRASVEATIAEFGANDYIHLTGGVPKDDVPRWLTEGDIFLNTTNLDNTPISIMEALATGLCVVSTNVGGIPFLLKHEDNALLVPPNDPEAMANAIRRILNEPELAEKLSRNARTKAESFDWSIVLPQWEKLLTEVIEEYG